MKMLFIVLIIVVLAICAVGLRQCNNGFQLGSGKATVQFFSWPSAEVYIDGLFAIEVPTSQSLFLSPGSHTLTFRPRKGGQSMVVQVKLRGGKHYYLRADLEERTYNLEVQR